MVCDLDLTFKGNPRSKVTRSTERSYMTSYMYFIQTLVTACTVSEILAQIDNKRPIGLIAPPFKIKFLATENWPKWNWSRFVYCKKIIHLASGCHIWSFFAQNHMLTKSKSRSIIASQITNLASRKSYLVIILPNSYQKLTKSKIR